MRRWWNRFAVVQFMERTRMTNKTGKPYELLELPVQAAFQVIVNQRDVLVPVRGTVSIRQRQAIDARCRLYFAKTAMR